MWKRFLSDFKKYYKYSIYSARASLKSEVANSYLNWLWWILEPLCMMMIYTVIFGKLFNASEQFFPVYIFIGLTMWDFFNKCIVQSVKLVKGNKAIVAKVYLPKFILIIVRMMINGFKMMISWGIIIGMLFAFHVPLSFTYLYFFPILLLLFLFTFGCCTFLLHYGVYVEDLANVVNIAMRLFFYMTGIFYDIEKRAGSAFGETIGKALNNWNPMAYMISSMRKAILDGDVIHRKFCLFWLAVSLILCFLGVRKIYKNENSYVKVV